LRYAPHLRFSLHAPRLTPHAPRLTLHPLRPYPHPLRRAGRWLDLDRQQPRAIARDERRACDALNRLRGSFHRERIQRPICIVDARAAATHQPQTAAFVEITRVTAPMPDPIANAYLRLAVTNASQIAAEHVRTRDDDLANAAGRQRLRVELRRGGRFEPP